MKRIYMFIMTILCSIGISIAVSYAWFLNDERIDPIAQGQSASAYFAYGDGTTTPYGINTQRHLYNLAWLVYLFPETYANKKYEIDPSLSGTLNMNGWILPPIGKDSAPFTGYFNGNGKTIENLETTNSISRMPIKPSNLTTVTNNVLNDCSNIGFFGSIEKEASETDAKIHDFYLKETTVHTGQSATCIGIVAGYVDAKIEDVGVVNSSLDFDSTSHSNLSGRTNLSDFTVVGYATEEYTTSVANSKTVIYNATTSYDHFNYRGMSGSATAWGGSINMTELYERIVALRPASTSRVKNSVTTYPTSQITYVNCNNDSITTITNSNNLTIGSNNTNVVRKMGGADGTYVKRNTSDTYNYLTSFYADTLIVTKLDSQESGETIKSQSGYYLNINSTHNSGTLTFSTSITSDDDNPTVWIEESNSPNVNLYTYNKDDGYKYYLSVDSSFNLTLENENNFSGIGWQWDSVYSTYKYIDSNSDAHYLKYIGGKWTVAATFYITDGVNYLVNNNGTITNTTSSENATLWISSEDSMDYNGYFIDCSNPSTRLAYSGNSLITNNSGSYWTYDGTNIFSGTKVIKFDGTNWIVDTINSYLIHYDGHYLRYNNGLGDTTTKSNDGTLWTLSNTLSNNDGNGKISYNNGNNTYYLRYNNGLTVTTNSNDSNTTWYHDANGIYITISNVKYYIQYDGSWKAGIQKTGYYISSGSNYLTAYGTTGTQNSTTPTTVWYVDQNNYVYTIINSTNYYLYANSSSWEISISTSTSQTYMYKKNNQSISYAYGYGDNYYIRCNNSSWSETSTATNLTWTTVTDNTAYASIGINTNYNSICNEVIIGNLIINNTNITSDVYSHVEKKEPSLFTYIPLLVDDDKKVKINNTGYIISGGYSGGSALTGQDIRVSRYDINEISGSYSNSNITKIYTCGYDSNGNRKIDTIGSSYFPADSFSKYNSSINDFDGIIDKNTSYVFGLHFMDASISKDNLVRLPNATISDDATLTNYQMPEDCIDFKLKQKGLINFYAGYYFHGQNSVYNDSFFSLHEIIRDERNYIIAINHIDKIYGKYKTVNGVKKIDMNYDFVYKYVDPSDITGKYYSNNSNSAPDGYSILFDRDWIENGDTTSTYRKNIFYFEIPVNDGEFALGSVSGKNGAYLMYLDIGANASIVDRTQVSQEIVNSISYYVYPNGIQVLSTNSGSIDAHDSYVAIIPSGTYSSISLSSTSITGANLNMSYNGTGGTVTNGTLVTRRIDGTTHYMTDVGAYQSQTTKVLKYYDYNNGRDRLYEVTVLQIDDNTPTYSVYCIYQDNTVVNNLIEDTTSDNAEYGLLVKGTGVDANYGVVPSSISSLVSNTSFRNTDNDKILEYYFEVLADFNNITENYTMNHEEITGSYKVNGITIAPGTNKLEQNDYYLQHVYRMTGDSVSVDVMAPNGATSTDYDTIIYISVYEPNRLEATGDTNPNYVFTINGITISNTLTTIDVTASAYSS